MSSYFKNSILVGDTTERVDQTGTLITVLPDYFSLNLPALYEWFDTLSDDWFTYVRVHFNDTLPRIAYEAYGNATYWDIIMLINDKSPYDCLPYDDDTLKTMATNKAIQYKERVYGNTLDSDSFTRLYDKYLTELESENDGRFIIKIIKPSCIQAFLQAGYEEDKF